MDNTLQDKLRTVATFMGLERVPVYTKGLPGNADSLGWQDLKTLGPKTETALNYHTDYNRLMEAWVKFRDLDLTKGPEGHSYYCDKIPDAIAFASILEAFERLHEA